MKHLDEVNETYWEHFKFASVTGLVMLIAGVLIIVHAIYPNICKTVGSDVIKHLHKVLEERNDK